jgi:hypothetical protein
MNKENDKKRKLYGQFAWILNYQPKIEHQHIHMGNQKVEDEPIGEEADYEEVKADKQKSNDKVDGVKDKKLNYKSPTIVLQRMLEGDWFDKNSTNKKLYNKEWRTKLVADLMVSKHGAYIAKLWEHDGKRPKIKANLIGTLVGAGVLTTNKSAIARTFLGISDKTRDEDEKREVNTFGTYIGRGKKEPYADWVKDYVDKMSQKK